MSVIASFVINGCPVIIGDLLVSGMEDMNTSCHIPTIGEVKKIFPEGSGFVPRGLEQKVIVIDENLVVAWAGIVFRAKAIIATIRNINSEKKFTPVTLWQFIQGIEHDPDYVDVSLIAMINENGNIYRYSIRSDFTILKGYGEVFVAGSGSEALLSYMEQLDLDEMPDIASLDPASAAIFVSISLFGMLITDEMHDPSSDGVHSLHSFFGGSYEVAIFIGNKIKKIDDISFTFFTAEIIDNKVTLLHKYFGLQSHTKY